MNRWQKSEKTDPKQSLVEHQIWYNGNPLCLALKFHKQTINEIHRLYTIVISNVHKNW